MTVAELIEHLKKCPQHLAVFLYYDGAARLLCDSALKIDDIYIWDSRISDDLILDGLVLCQKDDVSNPDKEVWFFYENK